MKSSRIAHARRRSLYWLAVLLTLVVGTAVLACGTSAPEPAATPAQSPVDIQPPATVETAAANPQFQAESVTDPTPIVVPAPVGGGPSKEEWAAVFSPNSSRASDSADNPPKAKLSKDKPPKETSRDPAAAQPPVDEAQTPVAPGATEGVPKPIAPASAETLEAGSSPVPTEAPTTATDSVATAAPTSTTQPTSAPRPTGGGTKGGLAAELKGIQAWINSDPLTIDGLQGKVVLIDFWTYTCINCIRTLPYLKEWHAKYQDDGLVIIGVHTPEFEFEKDLDNVVKATRDYGVEWAVAQDNDFRTWRAYSNRYWPAKYLIDHEGIVRFTHFGECQYAETELKIRELLEEAGVDLEADVFDMPLDQSRDQTYLNTRGARVTRELYAGYERALSSHRAGLGVYVGQLEYYRTRDEPTELLVPDEVDPHLMYFNGLWKSEAENAKHARASQDYEDFLELVYSARSVNAVLTSDSGEPYKVQVTQEGEFLTEENKGADVIIGEDGESYVLVTEPKMYRLIENPSYVQDRKLRMASDSEHFGLFAFTFGVYERGA